MTATMKIPSPARAPGFADLRKRLTRPTRDEVVAAIGAELAALIAEFGQTSEGGWDHSAEQVRRLARQVCADIHRPCPVGVALADILDAYAVGDLMTTQASFGADNDAAIDVCADRLVETAEMCAADWRANMRVTA